MKRPFKIDKEFIRAYRHMLHIIFYPRTPASIRRLFLEGWARAYVRDINSEVGKKCLRKFLVASERLRQAEKQERKDAKKHPDKKNRNITQNSEYDYWDRLGAAN